MQLAMTPYCEYWEAKIGERSIVASRAKKTTMQMSIHKQHFWLHLDVVQFGLEQSVYPVSESAGTVEVCVVASFSDNSQGSVTFDIVSSPGTASGNYLSVCLSLFLRLSVHLSVCPSGCSSYSLCFAGPGDYTGISQTLVLPAGATRTCVDITIIADAVVEADEFFMVTISSLDPSVQFTITSAEVLISDTTGESV